MGIFRDLETPFIGRVKKKILSPPKGTVRTPFSPPVWIGTREGSGVKRMMGTEDAQSWVRGGVDRSVKLYVKKQELDEL